METREITIIETKNQKKSVIMSAATTLAELKTDLRANDINYEGMTFFEGTSKTELKTDSSVLPHDVPYKGTVTNKLVFMLTNTNKKIKSGLMSRIEVYDAIRNMNLQDVCKAKYGKNFTMCKTSDLIVLVETNKKDSKKEDSKKENPVKVYTAPAIQASINSSCDKCIDVAAREAIKTLVYALYDNQYLSSAERYDVLSFIEDTIKKSKKDSIKSSYSDDELDDMFADIKF